MFKLASKGMDRESASFLKSQEERSKLKVRRDRTRVLHMLTVYVSRWKETNVCRLIAVVMVMDD